MTIQTVPNHQRSGRVRVLAARVPSHFEEFYRQSLRYRHGARLRVLEVARCYNEWAAEREASPIGFRQLRRLMLNIGHRHFRSNVTYFGDAVLVDQAPDLPDNYPDPPAEGLAIDPAEQPLLRQIDRTIAQLERLRAQVQVGVQ